MKPLNEPTGLFRGATSRVVVLLVLVPIWSNTSAGGDARADALARNLDGSDRRIRETATRHPVTLGGPSLPALLEVLTSGTPRAKREALDVLARLGMESDETIDFLIDLLASGDEELVARAVFVLGEVGARAEPAIPHLRRLATPNSPVRGAAVSAIARILVESDDSEVEPDSVEGPRGGGAAEPAEVRRVSPPSVESLISDLGHVDDAVQLRAGRALIARGEGAVPRLVALLENGTRQERREAAFLLGRIGRAAAGAVPALRNALEDTDRDTVSRSVFALGEIGHPASSAVVQMRGLASSDVGLERTVTAALAKIHADSEAAFQRVGEPRYLDDPWDAKPLVSEVGGRSSLPMSEPVGNARTNDPEGLHQAARHETGGLVEMEPSRAPRDRPRRGGTIPPDLVPTDRSGNEDDRVGTLINSLVGSDPTARREAVAALVRLSESSDRPTVALVQALDDRDPRIVSQAIFALGEIGAGAEEALPRLREFMYEESSHRGLALSSIARIVADVEGVEKDRASEPGVNREPLADAHETGVRDSAVRVAAERLASTSTSDREARSSSLVKNTGYFRPSPADREPAERDVGGRDMPPHVREPAGSRPPVVVASERPTATATTSGAPPTGANVGTASAPIASRAALDRLFAWIQPIRLTLILTAWFTCWGSTWFLLWCFRPAALARLARRVENGRMPFVSWAVLLEAFSVSRRVRRAWIRDAASAALRRVGVSTTLNARNVALFPVEWNGERHAGLDEGLVARVLSRRGRHVCVSGCDVDHRAGIVRRLCEHATTLGLLPVRVPEGWRGDTETLIASIAKAVGEECAPSRGIAVALMRKGDLLLVVDEGTSSRDLPRGRWTTVVSHDELEDERGNTLQTTVPTVEELPLFLRRTTNSVDASVSLSAEQVFEACQAMSRHVDENGATSTELEMFAVQLVHHEVSEGTLSLPSDFADVAVHYVFAVGRRAGLSDEHCRQAVSDSSVVARMSLSRKLRPSSVRREAVVARLVGSDALVRVQRLLDIGILVDGGDEESLDERGTRLRFCTESLAEWLAARHILLELNGSESRWRRHLFEIERALEVVRPGARFLLRVRACCRSRQDGVPSWVTSELGRILGIGRQRLQDESTLDEVTRAVRQLAATDADVRKSAAERLGRIGAGAASAIRSLAERLRDEEADVAIAAASSLAMIGSESVPVLSRIVDAPEADTRLLVLHALGRIGKTAGAALPRLIDRLNDRSHRVRGAAVTAIASVAPDAVVELTTMLQDEAPLVRGCTLKVLGEAGAGAGHSVQPIARLLNDDTPELRQLAAIALGQIGPAAVDATPALLSAALDDNQTVASTAVDAISRIGLAARPTLIRALRTGNDPIRAAAAGLLGRIGDRSEELVRELIRNLEDPNPTISMAVRTSLARVHNVDFDSTHRGSNAHLSRAPAA